MSNTNTGGPAFPSHEGYTNNYGQLTARGAHEGMTLRDYFAAKAMQGELAAQSEGSGFYTNADALAVRAYQLADEMLKARDQ